MKNWQFWFTIIGAVVTVLLMLTDVKQDVAVQSNDIQHVKEDVSQIKSDISDIRRLFPMIKNLTARMP